MKFSSVMNTEVTGAHAARAMYAFLDLAVRYTPGAWARKAPSGSLLVATGAPLATFNGVFCPDGEPEADDVMEFAARADGLPWSVFCRSEPSSELRAVAAAVGLAATHSSPMMVCPAGPLPEESTVVEARLIGVTDRSRYIDALAAGYEAPRDLFEELMSESIMTAPGVTCVLIEVAGDPVATGLGVLAEDLVGVYNVATPPEHRRRGYGRLAAEAVLREGYASGAVGSYLISSEMGEPLYRSMGFRSVETWTYLTSE